MQLEYQIGADPELFLRNAEGSFRSAHNVIPGSKEDPHPVLSGAIQPDGLAAEFNINPAKTAKEFSENIIDVLSELSNRVEQKGLSLFVSPTATFEARYFKKLPKAAKRLGCEPDFNVYSGTANLPPATKEPFRTGGGHIHVGWTDGMSVNDTSHIFDCTEAVIQLDRILYPMSLLWDDDDNRRKLYGKIGTYRAKHYGVEYRPLSNMWVADPDLHIWIFNATKEGMELLDAGVELSHDTFSSNIVDDIQNLPAKGERIPRSRLLEYHDYLVEEYMLPKLPVAYTRTVQ